MKTLYKLASGEITNYILEHAPQEIQHILTNPNLVEPVLKAVESYNQNKPFWDGLISLTKGAVSIIEPEIGSILHGFSDVPTEPSEMPQ